jgi:hypothetical protein
MVEQVCDQRNGVMNEKVVPKIDPEFKRLVHKLTPEETRILRGKLLKEGSVEPLVVWLEENILLDGHHRLELCVELGIPYETRYVSLPDRDAAKAWIAEHQLGRRNSTEAQKSYLRGLLHIQQQKGAGNPNLQKTQENPNGVSFTPLGRTRDRLAEEHGVSPDTIKNDTRFARDVDAVTAAVGDGAVQEVLTSGKATKAEVHALVGKDKEQAKKEIEEIRSRPRKKRKRKGAAPRGRPERKDTVAVPAEENRREPAADSAGGKGLKNRRGRKFHADRLKDLVETLGRRGSDEAGLVALFYKAIGDLEEDRLGAAEVGLRRYLMALVGLNDESLEGLQKIPGEAWGEFARDCPGSIKRIAEGCEALAAFLRTLGC